MRKGLQNKGYVLIYCNSCSVIQTYREYPLFCDICNSKDIELYIYGENRNQIKKLRKRYYFIEDILKKINGV